MPPAIVKLRNPILHYAWGSTEAIARLQGRESPTAEPEAELWIGDHPTAPSEVVQGGMHTPLPDWIARDPVPVLGAGRKHLPFLAKILAAARSLSVQVHPDADRAREGFARENAAGIPDARRSYRDPNPKHELLVALTRFEALCGLRDDDGVRGAASPLPAICRLAGSDPSAGPLALRLLLALQRLEGPERPAVLHELERFAAGEAAEASQVRRLLVEHPGDPLAAAPLFLNPVVLAPGEGLVVRPGTVHSYLCGTGVEVMTRSDNVVRAGLTSKHVDPDELRSVIRPAPGPPEVLAPVDEDGGGRSRRYDAGLDAFTLRVCELATDEQRVVRDPGTASLVLCVAGRVELREPAAPGAAPVALGPAEAALVPARVEAFQLRGTARTSQVFRVSSG